MIRSLKFAFFPFLFAVLAATPARADKPVFAFPVACALGKTCWIVNYVDADPAAGVAKDFRCGPMTYDDHNGTDIGVADLVGMEMGVDVLAAADGKVLRIRDGVEDKVVSAEERAQLLASDKGCGNGVFIDHGGGWQTIYCHMKKDSIAVKPGQEIRAGDRLGRVGMSGAAEFPHLHFGVFNDGHKIDPFTGRGTDEGCGKTGTPLWSESANPGYNPAALYAAGFKDGVPDFEAIKIDARGAQTLPAGSKALTFWISLFGVAEGDRIALEILDPKGEVFARRAIVQEKNRARQFYFVGRESGSGLAPGAYTGRIRLERLNANPPLIREETRTLTVR